MTYAEREAESRHGAEATDDARRRTAQRDETGGVPAPRDSIDEELREGSPVTRNIRSSTQYKPNRRGGIARASPTRRRPGCFRSDRDRVRAIARSSGRHPAPADLPLRELPRRTHSDGAAFKTPSGVFIMWNAEG